MALQHQCSVKKITILKNTSTTTRFVKLLIKLNYAFHITKKR